MANYRLDYVSLHDENGKPKWNGPITINDYIPALKNPIAKYLFLHRVKLDANQFNCVRNGIISFDFLVSRARHYGYLYEEVPTGLREYFKFYAEFFKKIR